MDDGREVFLRPQWTAPPRRLGLILQGLGGFCHFLLVAHSPWVSSRRCSSFRFFNDTLNLMNKRLQIFRFDHGGNAAMPQSPYPKPPFVVSNVVSLEWVNVSHSTVLEYVLKGGDSRWPLRGTTTKKVKNFKFRSMIVGRTYSPMF